MWHFSFHPAVVYGFPRASRCSHHPKPWRSVFWGQAAVPISSSRFSADLKVSGCAQGNRASVPGFWMFLPTGWKPNQRFACFYHGVNGVGWGGVGWGGVITFICTSSHIWCYVIVPHIYDATLLCGVGWGGVITFICTSSHIWCYVIVPHIYDARLLCGVGWGGVITFICTSSHIWCYVIVPHIYDATLLQYRLALPHEYDATLL